MKAIGVIPARYGSTRLPGKSLVKICGKPLIQWVWENARKATRLSDLLVATDDRRIVEAVEAIGGRAVMTRSDHPSGTDRIAEAMTGIDADIVVNIQGDEPLIEPALIDRLATTMMEGAVGAAWDMATAVTPIRNERDLNASSVVKAVWDCTGRALYFSRSVIPFVRDNDMGAAGILHWRHLGVYAYTRSFLARLVKAPPCLLERAEKLEQLRALHIGGRIAILEVNEAGIGVDTPADVQYVESILAGR